MGFLEFILAIVLIATVGGILKSRYEAQAKLPPVDDGEARRAREEIRQLKERIQVLERVITDNRAPSELDREIARLRDQ